MQLPESVKSIRARYVAAFPVPQGAPGEAHEENCRQWSIRFAEQVAFERPGEGWGMKRADGGRPVSKDTIARVLDGRLLMWDLLTGTGTGSPRLSENPEGEDITGQVFVPVVPTNRLGTPQQPPQEPPAPPPVVVPPVDLSPVLARCDGLAAGQQAIAAELAALRVGVEELLNRPTPAPTLPPALVGTLFGYRIRLTWEK